MYVGNLKFYRKEVIKMHKREKRDKASDTPVEIVSNNKVSLFIKKAVNSFAEHALGTVVLISVVIVSICFEFFSVKYLFPNQISNLESDVKGLKERTGKLETRVDNLEKGVTELNTRVGNLETRVGSLETRIGSLEKSIDKLSDKIDSLVKDINDNSKELQKTFDEEIKEAKEDLREENQAFKDGIEAALGIVKVRPTSYGASKISYSLVNLDIDSSHGPSWRANKVVGVDLKTGKKYKARNLVNKKILMSYKEDRQEIYFLGQYNSDYHWDGSCTINVYKKNELILATNANYDDGNLKNYNQALDDEDGAWIISNRKVHKNYNFGESWSYYKGKKCVKKFSMKTVKISDIVSVNTVKSKYTKGLEGYYYGRTHDGSYNDNTGKAYMVKYFKGSDYVRTLYCGCFKNGKFEDRSGKAWYIVKGDNTDYMYYKGIFKDGVAKYRDDKHFKNHLTKRDIEEIVKGYNFSCELKWDI